MKKAVFPIGLAFAFLLVNVIRILQLVIMIDSESGFYYESYEKLGNILTLVIVGITLLLIVLSIVTKQKERIAPPKPNNFLGVAGIMLGVSLAIEPWFVEKVSASVPVILQNLKTVTIILSGVIFVIIGFLNFIGKKPNYILCIVPSLSYVTRILVTFICYTGMSGISQNYFEIVNLCCILAFLHFSSKILCNVASKRTSLITIISACAAIITSSLCSVPQIIITFFGLSGVHISVDSIITNLFMLIYIIAFLISKKQNKAIEVVTENIENKTETIEDFFKEIE